MYLFDGSIFEHIKSTRRKQIKTDGENVEADAINTGIENGTKYHVYILKEQFIHLSTVDDYKRLSCQ